MSFTTTTKKKHTSTHSNGSTYPLPSLCSSLSSHNSSSKSLDNKQRKRWDDSQFAIDLCDDNATTTTTTTRTTKSLKDKILKSFHSNHEQKQQHNTRSPSNSSSLSSHSNSSQISVKFTLLLRKIKSMKS